MGDSSISDSFRDFGILPPSKDQVTLGQVNNEFVHISHGQDSEINRFVRGGGVVFPHIKIPKEIKLELGEMLIDQSKLGRNISTGSSGVVGVSSNRRSKVIDGLNNRNSSSVDARPRPEEEEMRILVALQYIIEFLFPVVFMKQIDIVAIMRDSMITKKFVDFYSGVSTNSVAGKIVVFLVQFLKVVENIIVFSLFGVLGANSSISSSSSRGSSKMAGHNATKPKVIKFACWHPTRSLLAIVPSSEVCDHDDNKLTDFVMLYDLTTNSFIENIFYNVDIGEIKGIIWKPNSGYTLVLNGELGACLLRFQPDANTQQSSNNNMATLKNCWIENLYINDGGKKNQDGAIAINSSGSLLVIGHNYGSANSFVAVDIDTQQKTLVKRGSFGFGFGFGLFIGGSSVGISEFSFSPNGQYLLTSHYGTNEIRLWSTLDWSSQVFGPLPGLPSSFNWVPNNKGCFFIVEGSSDILTLLIDQHGRSASSTTSSLASAQIAKVCSFTTHLAPTLEPAKNRLGQTEQIRVGGPISQLVLDPTGCRLAISFNSEQDMTCDISLVAVYNVDYNVMFTAGSSLDSGSSILVPAGYIRGPNWGSTNKDNVKLQLPSPENMFFAPNYDQGSLLVVTWANGTISFIQMHY